jgi:hypothetical protein
MPGPRAVTGQPRWKSDGADAEGGGLRASRAGRAAIAVLSVCPLALAALTPLEIRVIAAGLSPVVPGSLTMGALKSPWVLQPVFAGFSILSPSWLWVELPVMLGLVGLLVLGLSGRRLLQVRRVPAWRSPRWAWRARTPTRRSVTPTRPGGCWRACCTCSSRW